MGTKKQRFWMIAVLFGLLAISVAPPLRAQDAPPPDAHAQDVNVDQGQDQGQTQDPPSRVARLDYMSGSVSFQPGGQGDWVTAVQNRPLTTGDNLWADKDSRGELQIGSTSIRLGSETSLTFLDLGDHSTQLRLSLGALIVRVRHLDDEDHFEVDTPNVAFVIQRPGEYRLDVNADGTETDAVVWHGRGEATGAGASYTVVAGQDARFTGTDQINHDIEQVPANDDLDTWAFSRDEKEDHTESANYISTEMTGYEDLDEYGHWSYEGDYGPVWAPTVAAGWAPYRFGHWVWVAPWGWTWVEDEPWGFAPFHYGRWAFIGASWFWVPGPVVVRPVFAPALVAFVGGPHFGVGVGAGVAWFPLAPREVFVPWYHVSRAYVTNVNVTNTRVSVTEVTNVYHPTTVNSSTHITYANQRVAGGVTAVSRETFANARPVNANLVHVDEKQIANAPVEHNLSVKPEQASMTGAGRPASAHPPTAIENRSVVANRMPSASHAMASVRSEPMRSEQASPREGIGEMAHPVPHPSSRELVRPAPPVQENAQRQQSEQQKFNRWEQNRPRTSPPRSGGHDGRK